MFPRGPLRSTLVRRSSRALSTALMCQLMSRFRDGGLARIDLGRTAGAMGENWCARSCRCNPGVVLSTFVSPWEFEEDFWSVIGTSPTPIGTTKDMIRGTANVCLVSLNCSGVIPYYYQDFIDDFLDYAAGQRSCPMPPQYAWHCLATFMYVPPLHTILTLGVECAKTTDTAPEACTNNHDNP